MAEKKGTEYTVLIVDDDQDILTTMRMAISGLGPKVITASDGLKGVEMAEKEDPDIIVLDLMLPRRGGFNILQNIKGSPDKKGKRPLTCMVTGNEGMRHKTFAEQLGVDDYLRKPFAMDRLVEIVKRFTDKLDEGVEDA